jgi:hypothetical protein
MTPESQAKIDAITKPVDALMAQVVAAATRIAQTQASEDQSLLRAVAARIETDSDFRAAVVMLACD